MVKALIHLRPNHAPTPMTMNIKKRVRMMAKLSSGIFDSLYECWVEISALLCCVTNCITGNGVVFSCVV